MEKFSDTHFRQQFPILKSRVNGHALVYFDNAATTQKPACVIERYQEYYQQSNANVHRASHALSASATADYESARKKVKSLINANAEEEIIWTKGSTESINLVAQSWGRTTLQPGDEIVLSYSEHHANIVPWQIVAKQTGATIKVLPLGKTGQIAIADLEDYIGERTRIVCVGHISNVIGRVNPIKEVIRVAKKHQALTLIDGAQAIAHLKVDVNDLDCDFYVFSAHKMYGPTGIGVLYGKRALLDKMPPYQAGGEMIKTVSFEQTTFNQLPHKFEAGTPNIAGVIAFGSALEFLEQQDHLGLVAYENALTSYCFSELSSIPRLKFLVDEAPDIPLFSFTLPGHHNHDIAAALDSVGIAVRAGHHCTMPLMQYLNVAGCIRLSLSAYNSVQEIDFVIEQLKKLTQTVITGSQPASLSLDNKAASCSSPEIARLTVDDIYIMFAKAKSWDSKHREIMLLGKKQLPMAVEDKTPLSLIAGCESHAWLVSDINAAGVYRFKADSEAKVIRGLLAIILAAVDNKTAAEIHAFDMNNYFSDLGLLQHLSPSRGNGVRAIVQKIQQLITE